MIAGKTRPVARCARKYFTIDRQAWVLPRASAKSTPVPRTERQAWGNISPSKFLREPPPHDAAGMSIEFPKNDFIYESWTK